MTSLPNSIEAERNVLGAVLLDPSLWAIAKDEIDEADLYRDAHRNLWRLLERIHGDGCNQGADIVVVCDEVLAKGEEGYGGVSYVMKLADDVVSTQNVEHYAELVRRSALRRRLIETGQRLTEAAQDGADVEEALTAGEKALQALAGSSARDAWRTNREVCDEQWTEYGRRTDLRMRGEKPGIPTTFHELDRMIGGLRPTDLAILAARPAMGKTAWALNVLRAAAKFAPVAFCSQEMTAGQCVDRHMAAEANVEASLIRDGLGRDDMDDRGRMADAVEVLSKLPIYWLDIDCKVSYLRSQCRRLKAREPNLALVVVDYLQLMEPENRRDLREQQISQMSRGFKQMARELDVSVLALSQLNRSCETRPNKRPLMADLRESGAIEQDADLVVFLYRDDYYNPESDDKGLAEVLVRKNRHGQTGTVKLRFEGQYMRFGSLDTRYGWEK